MRIAPTRTALHRRSALAVAVLVAAGGLVAGCGSDTPGDKDLDEAARQGRQVAEDWGCTGCHSSDGADRTGPTWQDIWGTTVRLDDGRSAVVDADYITRSIREPDADVIEGFDAVMPTFNLSDAEIDQIVAYIRALGNSE